MKHRLLILLPAMLLLTGCTDLRTRISPDVIAADCGEALSLAASVPQEELLLRAAAETPEGIPAALQNAGGAEFSQGHVSMLALSGAGICDALSVCFTRGWIPPDCTVLAVSGNAANALANAALPDADQLRAAADTGMLPCRTADAVIGDLWGGSGMTVLPLMQDGSLTLAVAGQNGALHPLSGDACRGLALLGCRWKEFGFAEEGIAYTVTACRLHLTFSRQDGQLVCTVAGTLRCDPAKAAGEAALRRMLLAALTETAAAYGADVCCLRESAVQSGLREIGTLPDAAWADLLRTAEYRADLHV